MQVRCAHCGKASDKPAGAVNRAQAAGLRLFCDRRCAGLGRRRPGKPKAQKVAEKQAYDADYRLLNRERIAAGKAAHHQATYDPAAARIERKKRAVFHAEYCRRPSYRLWKAEYDRRRRDQEYGEFADAQRLTIELNREIKSRSSNYEIRRQNQTGNKAQDRDRSSTGPKRDDSYPSAHRE